MDQSTPRASPDDLPYRQSAFGRTYWLAHSDGFRVVDLAGRRVAIVEEVVFAPAIDVPDALVVRGGLLGTRTFLVAAADVAEVRPGERRLVIVGSPRTASRNRLKMRTPWAVRRPAPGTKGR